MSVLTMMLTCSWSIPRTDSCRFQLSFYRNMVIHLFISEAIVAVAMYTRIKQGGGPANQVVPYDVLFEQVDFLSTVSPTFHSTITSFSKPSLAFPWRIRLPLRGNQSKLTKDSYRP